MRKLDIIKAIDALPAEVRQVIIKTIQLRKADGSDVNLSKIKVSLMEVQKEMTIYRNAQKKKLLKLKS